MGSNVSVCFSDTSSPLNFSKDGLDSIPTNKIHTNSTNNKMPAKEFINVSPSTLDKKETEILVDDCDSPGLESDSEQSILAELSPKRSISNHRYSSPNKNASLNWQEGVSQKISFLKLEGALCEISVMKKFRELIEMGSIESTKNYIDANEIDASVVYQLEPDFLSPLHIAVSKRNVPMVALLLSEGADLHVRDESGRTALARAFELGDIEIVNMLAAAKDAEFKRSPFSPYAPSSTTKSSALSIAGDLNTIRSRLNTNDEIIFSRNSSFRSTRSVTFENVNQQPSNLPRVVFQPSPSNSASAKANTNVSADLLQIEDGAATTGDIEPETRIDDVCMTESKAALLLPYQLEKSTKKNKKPLTVRLQKAAGKMLSMVRPNHHSQSLNSRRSYPTSRTKHTMSFK